MALLTSSWVLDGAIIFLSLIFAAYLYMTRNFKYWARKGVMEIQPTPFFGNFADCMLFRRTPAEFFKDLYDRSKGLKYVGIYIFDKPTLLLLDRTVIKNVLIRDFDYFVDRFLSYGKHDALGIANLFVLEHRHWKDLRNKLTPIFSPVKLKKMFDLMTAVSQQLNSHLEACDFNADGRVIELKGTCAKYSIDMIGSCAFGLNVNCLNNPDSQFKKYAFKAFELTYKRGIQFATVFFVPTIAKLLRLTLFEESFSNFLRKVMRSAINERVESGQRRNDLVDTLIELRKASAETDYDDPEIFKIDGDNLVAQAAIFLIAGYESSSTTMSFTLYELALQSDIQTRLRNDINSALEENEGKLTYEMVMNLPYLDMVVSETLRKYTSLTFLNRVAARDYKVPGTDLIIEKDTPVYVPLSGLHYDPQYFPDPQKFDPERFSDETNKKRPSCVYMPFGDGPHHCIGLRFGQLQVKLFLITILSKYEVTPCDRTQIPMVFDPKSIFLTSRSGVYLNMRKIASG